MSNDFVARAGAIIDRAHRIAGVLLICVVVLGSISTCQLTRNAALNAQLMDARVRLPVIVVPGATTGLYSPTEDDRLTYMFTDLITQLFNSFTSLTFVKQYEEAKKFFDATLLVDSAPYFEKKVRDSQADKRASLFVPDRTSYKVKKYVKNGIEMRDVSMTGQINTIIGGVVAESVWVRLDMTLRKDTVSPANPYGLVLVSYHETPLETEMQIKEANAPQQDGGPTRFTTPPDAQSQQPAQTQPAN